MIGIVNLGFSNKTSICNALNSLDLEFEVFDDSSKCSSYKGIILPGVGNFSLASKELTNTNFKKEIVKFIDNGGYFLGVCLGMQLLFTNGFENGSSQGLDIIKGKVVKLNEDTHATLMHIGWNEAFQNQNNEIEIFKDITEEENFYFVHGYHAIVEEDVKCLYSNVGLDKILSAIQKNKVFGVQFHPEKSHKPGEKLLLNFYDKVYKD